MSENVFVGRTRELQHLHVALNRAVTEHGQVILVVGEPGAGKTALLVEFAAQAQRRHSNLIVAVGNCNAQTGVGQAYLPFREVLGMLTGDLETKLSQGMITTDSADNLRKFFARSALLLLDVAPDLIEFLPGGKLVTTAATVASSVGKAVSKQADLEERLREMVDRKSAALELGQQPLAQELIFEQCTNYLRALAAEQPLLLVLDDLHWADTSSISLLFHLGRRLQEDNVFIVGSVRPEEIAAGWGGEHHPLEKLVAEFKRYYGDIFVDLSYTDEEDARRFVDAYVDAFPNILTTAFRAQLTAHTGGNPLFLVEVMRTLQERGQIVQNEHGYWMETGDLDWQQIPSRVEGVIEERLERLDDDLQELLRMASVEGETFEAETLARLRKSDARETVQILSGDLSKQHRLVRAINMIRMGGQRLSIYQFNHRPVQKYLYGQLDQVQLAYLHEDIALILEELYGDQRTEIAVQLAWHFMKAGLDQKAAQYLTLAGKQAFQQFSHDEAIIHLSQALQYVPEGDVQTRYQILLVRESVYSWIGQHEEQERDLEALAELIDSLPPNTRSEARAEVLLRQAEWARVSGEYEAAISYAQQAVQEADAAGSVEKMAAAYASWGRVLIKGENISDGQVWLELALELAQSSGAASLEAELLWALGTCFHTRNQFAEAEEQWQRAFGIYERLGNRQGQADCLYTLGTLYLVTGRYDIALTNLNEALDIARKIGWRLGEAAMLGNLGAAYEILGSYERAASTHEMVLKLNEELDDAEGIAFSLDTLGLVKHRLGQHEQAQELIEKALAQSRERGDIRHQAIVLVHLGYVLMARRQYQAAADAYKEGMAIYEGLDTSGGASIDGLAGLAAIALAQEDMDMALEHANQIWEWLGEHDSESVEYPVQVYWILYQVLTAGGSDLAPQVLEQGYTLLQSRAALIDDENLAHHYLSAVPFNRDVTAAWQSRNT